MKNIDLPELTAEQQTDIQRQVADAKLGVAEDLAWHGAIFLALMIWLRWDSWLGAGVTAVAYYWIVTRYYGRDHDRAGKVQAGRRDASALSLQSF